MGYSRGAPAVGGVTILTVTWEGAVVGVPRWLMAACAADRHCAEISSLFVTVSAGEEGMAAEERETALTVTA